MPWLVERPGPDDSVAPGVVIAMGKEIGMAHAVGDQGDWHFDYLPWLLRARAWMFAHPALLVGAAMVSTALTICFLAAGHRLLALVV